MKKQSNGYNIKIDEKKYAEFRHSLHRIPELKNTEKDTKQFILDYIKSFKNYTKIKLIEVKDCTGFWIDIIGEGKPNLNLKTNNNDLYGIALRCDLDALPLKEETGVEYISTHDGIAHSCGHDGHMTLSTCFLEYMLERLDILPSNVILRYLYQPAEEGGNGAVTMINAGCLNGISEIYGIHNNTLFNLGEIGVKEGALMASALFFDIEVIGKGGHGSMPHLCNSPITTGSEIVQKLNQITSQKIDSAKRCVVTIGSFNSGETGNVIPERALLKGTARTLDNDTQKQIKDIITSTCKKIADENDSQVNVNASEEGLVTYNNPELTNSIAIPAIQKAGFTVVKDKLPVMGSEDFSYYQAKIPGVFVMLGTGDDKHTAFIHSPQFDYNDLGTPYGVEVYARILEVKLGITLIN